MNIIPAILPKNFAEIQDKVAQINGRKSWIQIDICDGVFVPSKTWPYVSDKGELQSLLAQDTGLPQWETYNFEFDLMIQDPEKTLEQWIAIGASRIIVHATSTTDIAKCLDIIDTRAEVYIALKPESDMSTITNLIEKNIIPHIDRIHGIQVMGIEHIGVQGQPFSAKALELISLIRNHPDISKTITDKNFVIAVDGSVNEDTIEDFAKAGATQFVIGSAIFNNPHFIDTREAIRHFDDILESYVTR